MAMTTRSSMRVKPERQREPGADTVGRRCEMKGMKGMNGIVGIMGNFIWVRKGKRAGEAKRGKRVVGKVSGEERCCVKACWERVKVGSKRR